MQLAEQRVESPRRVLSRVKPPDPDFADTIRESITLPESWWERLEAVAKARETDRFGTIIQLTRWSLDLGDSPAQPEGSDLKGVKRTNSVYLSRKRWEQMRAEMKRRGLSLNKVFQSHLYRALVGEEADIAAERKPAKR